MNSPLEVAELISLGLTSPTLISAAVVVVIWWKPAIRSLKSKKRDGKQWLILGVAISFVGGFLDNLWWGSAWGHFFLEMEQAKWWFDHGVVSNIPFRQLAGISAGYCHIRSAMVSDHSSNPSLRFLNSVLLASVILSSIAWLAARHFL